MTKVHTYSLTCSTTAPRLIWYALCACLHMHTCMQYSHMNIPQPQQSQRNWVGSARVYKSTGWCSVLVKLCTILTCNNVTLPMHCFHRPFKLHNTVHQSNAVHCKSMHCISDRLHILYKRRPPGLHKEDFLIWRPNLIWKAVQGISNGIWSLNLVWFDAKTWSDVKKVKYYRMQDLYIKGLNQMHVLAAPNKASSQNIFFGKDLLELCNWKIRWLANHHIQ